MDAVVMCGGAGTRLGDAAGEKPLATVGGAAMVERVRRALAAAAAVDRVHAVVSPATPRTREWAETADCTVVEGTGEGYVADLERGLERAGTPAVTAVADVPLLAGEHVDAAVRRAQGGPDSGSPTETESLAVCVPAALKRALSASVDSAFTPADAARELAPAGLNVVADGDDRTRVSWDARLAVNVNRPADLALARDLATE